MNQIINYQTFTYNDTTMHTGESFYFFKNLYIQHAKTYQPAWKTTLYTITNIMPSFQRWFTLCIELNTIKTQPEYYSVLQHFHAQPEEKIDNKKKDTSIIDMLKTKPELTQALFNGIHKHNKMPQYEKTLQQLLTQTKITSMETLITLTVLEATPEQAEEYKNLPEAYINALL